LAARHDGFLPPALSLEPVLQPVERIFVSRVKLLRGIATGILICVFVPILLLQDFRSEIGNSLIRFGEKLKGNSETQLAPIMSMPIQSSTPSSGSTPSVPKSNLEIHSQETLSQPNPAASDQTPQGASSSTDLGLEDRQYSSKHLADVHSERGRSLLTQRLWSAIGSGDISAEVALAQLYLTGDGVPKNCDQARVLLKAASRNGNIEALQELRKLSRSGCR
jgi:hypothetical protein